MNDTNTEINVFIIVIIIATPKVPFAETATNKVGSDKGFNALLITK